MIRPNLFIVGAPKCGTSSMYEYLFQHPGICFSKFKEPNYFNTDRARRKSPSEASYLKQFSDCSEATWVGEASTWYLFSKVAAENIHCFNPDARIIIMLRDPVDTMYSLHSQNIFNGIEPERDFGKAMSLEQARHERFASGERVNVNLFYRDVVRFSEQIERYFKVFGRDRVHVIRFDDLKTDVQSVYRKTLEFLGVDANFTPTFEIVNPNKQPKYLWLRNLVRHPPNFVRRIAKIIVPGYWTRRILVDKINLANSKTMVRDILDPDLRIQLKQEMRPEVERLEKLLGWDLSSWK